MIYLVFWSDDLIAAFRDQTEAQEYVEMIKDISRRFYREHDQYQHRPVKEIQKIAVQYNNEMLTLIKKHLPTETSALEEKSQAYAEALVDDYEREFKIVEIPLTSFHLQEKLQESVERKWQRNAGIIND